jgi:hypothetical protein
MRRRILTLAAIAFMAASSMAAAPGDVMKPIRQFIVAFNSGDTKTASAAYATGEITIVDEFAPYHWTGLHALQDWFAEYDKHAQKTGVTDGKVTYGAPTRTEIEGDLAYVIIPTVYLYKERGKPIAEEGQVALVLHAESGAWKIRSWTWTGVKPHPAR